MSPKVAFFIFALTIVQVLGSPSHVLPDFIENVNDASSRIVSGWQAPPGLHPHQASLRMVDSSGGVSSCGGSFVHRSWVITAAHCTAGRITLVVRGGAANITVPQYMSETTEWYNHPTYDDSRPLVVQPNDISIAKLQHPIVFSALLQPILVQSRADAFRNYDAEVVYTSGYGRVWTDGATSEVLNWVYLRATSNPTCAWTFGSALITDNAICAGFYNVTSQSPCSGDSGGPLVHVNPEGVPILIGVTSFVAGGTHGCHSGFPAGFIRPGPFQDWLTEITGLDFENLDEEELTTTPTPTTTTLAPTTTTIVPSTTTIAPTTTTTVAPTDPPTTPDSEEEDEDEDDEDSDEDSDEIDPELAELMKRLEVKVKVKVKMNKFIKKKKVHIKKDL